LIVYDTANSLIAQRARNIPGVDFCHVERLNLLELAPGGHLGRLIIWTRGAIEQLNTIFGTEKAPGQQKKGYVLQRPLLQNASLSRVINSNEVQTIVRPKQKNVVLHDRSKKNPLKNKSKMNFLNPHARVNRENFVKQTEESKKNRDQRIKNKRGVRKTYRKQKKIIHC